MNECVQKAIGLGCEEQREGRGEGTRDGASNYISLIKSSATSAQPSPIIGKLNEWVWSWPLATHSGGVAGGK